FSAGLSHRTVRSGGLFIDGEPRPYAEEQWAARLGTQPPIVRHPDHSVTLTLDYHYTHFGSADPVDAPLDPNRAITQLPEHGALAGISAGFVFSNVRRYGFSVSPEEGRTLALNLSLDEEGFGGDFHALEASWSWTEFLQLPWRRHVLVLNYSGGIGE